MSTVRSTHRPKVKSMWKERSKKQHWAVGRRVAILPDVPGKRFNPEDTIFLKTPEEQKMGRVAIRGVLDKLLRDGKPSWYNPKPQADTVE